MTPQLPARVHVVLATVLAVAIAGSAATAQSQSDLRRENQRLQSQVSDLERELEAARERIAELDALVQQLREAVEAARRGEQPRVPPPPLEEPTVTIDESVPTASPRTLMNALVGRYQHTMGPMPMGEYGDKERTQYLKAVRNWVALN
ncbi:MAG: LapA family protein, partial [Planctomycetota bacterium]